MPKRKKITSIHVRMYRAGTGDFFILLFKKGIKTTFRMMIDCGCISAGKETFEPLLKDLEEHAGKTIDLLVVTHEHADHINGFEKCAHLLDNFIFKNVWFAWTESDQDPVANDYRTHNSELKMALNAAATKLNQLVAGKHYERLFKNEIGSQLMVEGRKRFIESLNAINGLAPANGLPAAGQPLPTMVQLLKRYKVIKANTTVECLLPGEVKTDIPGAPGIRFYVLGPPRSETYLNRTEAEGESYEKRQQKSTMDFAFLSALRAGTSLAGATDLPFEPKYEAKTDDQAIQDAYNSADWRKIDHDWLYSAGSLALRYERSINNTSLALAIQFEDSERVLLFPGDAELGNWQSWHDSLEWPVKSDGEIVSKKADYFLAKTVFYKVGHHLSQNGTAKIKGIELMNSSELTAMATLDLKKINKTWLNTMPNDLLGAELIRKTKGKLYFVGDHKQILKNIKTSRVTIKSTDQATLETLNERFNGKLFVDCEVIG